MQFIKEAKTAQRNVALTELAIRELEERHKDKQEDLIRYIRYFFENEKNQVFQHNWHHDLIADKLNKVLSGEITRLMINIPPGHMKTELVTKCFPVWALGKDPTREIIATGYSTSLTQTYSSQARDYYRSATHHEVFPRTPALRADQDTKEWWTNVQGGGYYATGTSGSITGRRFNIFIIDDPLRPDDGESTVKRDSVNVWYENTVLSRLYSPLNDAVIIIMQRVHDADLCGFLLDKMEKGVGEEWEVVSLPAIAIEQEDHRDVGEALHIERYPIEALMKLKKSYGSINFSCQYQQDPVSDEIREFKKEWIQRWERLPDRLRIRVIVDLAASEDKRSDENAILVIGEAADRRRYILESWGDWGDENRRFNPGEVIEKIYELCDKYADKDPLISIHVEVVSYQQTMQYWLNQHAKNRRHEGKKIYRVDEIKTPTTKSKDDKIRALIPFMSNKLVYFPHAGTKELENQIMRFPKATRVDRLDTLSMDLDIERIPAPHSHRKVKKPVYDKISGRVLRYV